MKVYQNIIRVNKEHLDALEHVNNVVYLQWVQDIAADHWYSEAGQWAEKMVWVARKHEIEYLKSAFLGESLTLKTWVEKMEGFSSWRKVQVLRGEEVICQCLTHWIALNPETQKPLRLNSTILNLFDH